jgi:hypothetical protein
VESIGDIPHAAVVSHSIGLLYQDNLRQPAQAVAFYEKSMGYYERLGEKDKVAELQRRIEGCRGKG